MSLEKSTISWSAKQLSKMVLSGKIDFTHIVQRSFVWEPARKSALIESMILGYPIPPIYAKRIASEDAKINTTYYIMDGKQRLSTIAQYINNEFALTSLSPIKYMDESDCQEYELDLSGKKYDELPEQIKDNLSSVMLSVIYFDNLQADEEIELFKRLNAGKPLSAKSRLLASCHDLQSVLDIGNHPIFEEMLTSKARENKNQVSLVMKVWAMLNIPIENLSFDSKSFSSIVESSNISDEERIRIHNILDFLKSVHDILLENHDKKSAKKVYTETHFVSIIPFVEEALKNGINEDMFADWIHEFFGAEDKTSIFEIYNESCGSGSAKNISIVERNDALYDSITAFFKAD